MLNITITYSQNPDTKRTYHWYFGNEAGIDFSSGGPIAVTDGSMYSIEGSATISDTSGNLLFYTDGDTIWNKIHQVMPNGTGLMGHWSAWQNSIIVPQPENPNIYYIFTADAAENAFVNGIRYSVVDMTLNTGLGDVSDKNILLFAPNMEGLASVHHSNCKDIWVMGHKAYTNDFYAYLVTSTGVNPIPTITTIGNCANTPYGTGLGIKFSPDGSMLATSNFFDYATNSAVRDTIELYSFDRTNGTLNNKILLPDTVIYGYSFSPNSQKLYVSTGLWTTKVYQYDLSVYIQSAVLASKNLIYETDYSTYYLEMQITPDQKIFLVKYSKDSLSVIDSPNLLGASCNYQNNGFSLMGREAKYSLPNFIESYYDATLCPTSIEDISNDEENILVYPNPFNTYFNIIIPNYNNDDVLPTLFDLAWKEIDTHFTKVYYDNKMHITIYGHELQPGMYLLKIENDQSKIYFKKIIMSNQ